MRIAAVAMLAALMGGCANPGAGTGTNATTSLGVIGTEQGGRVPYGPGNLQAAMNAATVHCAKFGKRAQITQMAPAPDGSGAIGFECRGSAS